MKYLNMKSLVISISIGIISLFMSYNGFKIYLFDFNKTIEVCEILMLIGSAITGPIGALLIAIISKSHQILGEHNYFPFLVQLFSLVIFSLAYKNYVYRKFYFTLYPVGWAILVFFYYFIFPLPVIFGWYLFNPILLEIPTEQQNLLKIISAWYNYEIYQFLYNVVFSTLMMSSLPDQIKKTFWLNVEKTKSNNSSEIKNTFIKKNLLTIRLFIWFLVISIIPLSVLITSIIRDYSFSVLKQEAMVRKDLVESVRLRFTDLKREEVKQFLEGVSISLEGELFILDTLGNYLFIKDSSKVRKSAGLDYSTSIISTILSQENGYLIDEKNKISFGFTTIKGIIHTFKVVSVSNPNKIITLSSNLFNELKITFVLGALIISFSFFLILWLLVRNPVNKLTNVVEKISEGNYDLRLNEEDLIDDIKILASSFNQMADKIISIEKRFRELLDLLPLTIAEADSNGKLLYVNSKGYEVFGYCPSEFSNNFSVFDFIEEKDRDRAINNFIRVINGLQYDGNEYTAVKKDGTRFPVAIYSTIIFKETVPVGLRSIIVDLSEKKESEAKLVESIKKLEFIASAVNIGFWEYDYETKSIFRSEKWAEMLGYKPEEILPTRDFWLNLIHPDDKQETEKLVCEIDNGQTNSYQIIHRLRCKNGDYKWIFNYGKVTEYFKDGFPRISSGIHIDIDEKIRIEEKLKTTEEKFSAIIDGLSDIVSFLNAEGKYEYVTPSFTKKLGYHRDEVIGKSAFDFIHLDDLELVKNEFFKSLNGIDNEIPIVFRVRKKDNGYIYVEAVSTNLFDNPAVNGLIVFGRDVTERISSDLKLKESEERFSKAFISSPVALALTNLDTGEYIDVNESWEKVFGYLKNEVIGRTSLEIGIYNNLEERNKVVSLIKQKNGIRNYEVLFKKKSGEIIYAFWSAEIIKINESELLLSSIYDFTRQKEYERKILASEERFKSIIQGLNDMIIIVNIDGKLNYISSAVTKTLGYSEEEMIGKSPIEFIHPDDAEYATKALEEVFELTDKGSTNIYRAKCKDGSFIYMESCGINMLNNEYVQGVVVFGKNITEQIISQKNLIESERRFSNLLLNIQDPILLLSFDGFVKYVNPACYKLIQAEESVNLVGTSFTNFMNEKEIERAFSDISLIKENGGPITAIYEIITFKGEKRWINATGVKITFDNEAVDLITLKDITEIKTSQNVLELSEKRFKSVWENTLDAMRLTDEIGTIVMVNKAYCDLVKKSKEELIGANLSIVSLELYREQVINDYISNFQNKSLRSKYETELELWNGEVIFVEVAHSFLTIENQSTLLLTVFHNITDKVEAKKSLVENEERFRITVEQTEQIFFDLDIRTGKIIWNGAIEQLTGFSSEEFNKINAKKWEELIHPYDKVNTVILLEKAINQIGNYQCEYRISKKDGSYIIVEERAVILLGENKQPVRILGTLKDVTEKKLALIREEERTKRIESQSSALIEIITNEFILNADFKSAIKFITEKVSKTINVERVSIWSFESNNTLLKCKNLYLASENKHSDGLVLEIEKYPNYFRALENNLAIVANDVINDKRTKEFNDDYLIPLNIKSVIDIGIKESGKTIGVICLEHTNYRREWFEDEVTFVIHIAEQLSILFSSYKKKVIEEELEKSERQYRTLIENLNEAIMLVDNDDRVLFVNEKFQELLGYTSEEIIGKVGYEILLHPSEKHKIISANLERIKGRGGQYEARFVKKNGEYVDFLINGSPVFDNFGNVIGSLGALTDITERKKAEEIIKIKSENFKRIFDIAPFGMVIASLGPEAIILNVNKAHCEIIERSSDDLIGKQTNLFFEESVFAELSMIFQRDGMIKNYEYSFVTPLGNKKIILLSTFFIEFDNQLCTLSVIEDVTAKRQIEIELEQHRINLERLIKERTSELELVNKQLQEEIVKQKQAEEKVRKALEKEIELNELKTKFISIASHEFRTPLATMLSSTELVDLFHKNNAEEKFQLQLQRIRNNINHLTEIIDDVLVISRNDAGEVKCDKVFVKADDFLQEIIEDTKILLSPIHQLNYNNSIQNEQIFIDPKLFRVVLMNLISNAIKYSPEGGIVGVEILKQKKKIIFKISDQGIGIPTRDHKKLFEPFHRSDNVGSIRGTGLGLAIVKKYVDLHSGSIKIKSKEGEGSTFIVSIPNSDL